MKAVFKLLNSYYIRGFFGPFFVVVFPVMILFIMGNASTKIAGHYISMGDARMMLGGVLITTLISNGLFGFPTMIIEFKKSTLMKRIGAAHISKRSFFMAALGYMSVISLFSIIWTLFWGGIVIGTKAQYDWSVAFNSNLALSIPFLIIAFMVSLGMGLIILSFVNTQQGVMGVSNILYLFVSFLSGMFIPKNQINSSPVLSDISYVLPTKYAVDPFLAAFSNGTKGLQDMGWEAYGFPLIAIAIFALGVVAAVKKFKWSA